MDVHPGLLEWCWGLDSEVEVALLAQSPAWLIIFLTGEVQSEISWEF